MTNTFCNSCTTGNFQRVFFQQNVISLDSRVFKSEKNWAFVDMQNIYKEVRRRGWRIEWKLFRQYLEKEYRVTKAVVFMGYVKENESFYSFLENSGFTLQFRKVNRLKDGTIEGGNVDADLASYIMDYKTDYQKAIEEFGSNDIVKYHRWLEVHYGSYSIQYAMVVLKNFFKYFKLRDCKCLSPELIRLPRISIKSHRAITEGEYNRIINVIPTNEFLFLRDSILIRLLWDTGVRVSELCDLDTSHIDENKTSAIIYTKKTGKKRAIVWSAETHALLMKYMPMRMELEKLNGASALFVGKHFNREWSMRLTTKTVQRCVRQYVKQAGIKEKITPHSFRHGWAHKRRDNNAPLAFIQKGLGHINPISTFVYEQYDDKEFMTNARQYLKAA